MRNGSHILHNHILGKTVLVQSSITRDAQTIVDDQEGDSSHLFIICVWQRGADALRNQYKQFESGLPKSDRLETMVVTKEELMKKFKATVQEIEATTNQINTVCKNINSLVKDKQVHLLLTKLGSLYPRHTQPI